MKYFDLKLKHTPKCDKRNKVLGWVVSILVGVLIGYSVAQALTEII